MTSSSFVSEKFFKDNEAILPVIMGEIVVKVPPDLAELENASPITWQLAIEERLKQEFEEMARLKRILDKSEMTEEQAKQLADEVSLALAKRYERSLKGE